MSTTTIKPVAKLDASLLLARKGEARPAVTATQHNNPALAWGEGEPNRAMTVAAGARLRPDSFFAHRARTGQAQTRAYAETEQVALTLRIEDGTYLRIKYLAQNTGRSAQQVLLEALDGHLTLKGVPRVNRLVLKPEQ